MLYEPLTLRCGVTLPNRLALAPMTNQQSHPDGTLADDELNWLARRADGGFGTIATCAAFVGLGGKAWEGELGVDRDDDLPGLKRLADRIHAAGAIAMVQLFHGGVRAAQKLTGEQVWSASTWHEDGADFETPRPATIDDIARVIRQFGDAAARCEQAGFDGVELHGAHGYLLCQFLSATMNPRTDGWGGDLVGRARLIREVMRTVRGKVGKRFAVGARLSLEDWGHAKGLDLDESLQVSQWLCDDGADFIHASLWNAQRNTKKRPDAHPLALVRAAIPADVALFTAGSIWTRAEAEEARTRGADVIALGRAAIVNPDWPKQARDPSWQPKRTPVTRAELIAAALSPQFVEYMTRWKNFVAA
jgi:2,4-dienoyl-CoA reductase-like NADH-dependent reductase (Old Yellow Enzyme family)